MKVEGVPVRRKAMSLEEFTSLAKYFDRISGDRTEEIDFFKRTLRPYGKKILDVACGTGAIAIPLAHYGFHVTGIDQSQQMLDEANTKLQHVRPIIRNRIALSKEDMKSFRLDERNFDGAFIAFNTFLFMTQRKDQRATLASIRNHLRTGGALLLDVFQPDYLRPQGVLRLERNYRDPTTGTTIVRLTQQTINPQDQVTHVWSLTLARERRKEWQFFSDEFDLYLYSKSELQLLLESQGFQIIDIYGDYKRHPFDRDSKKMLFLAEKSS